jgi:hypothetical protein
MALEQPHQDKLDRLITLDSDDGAPAAPPAPPASNFDPRLIAPATTSEQIPPGPYSEHELQTEWDAQADEHNQWESLDSSEQLAWAQARAIAADRNGRPRLRR